MSKRLVFLLTSILVLLLAACSPSTGATTAASADSPAVGELDADYDDALSVQGQLALGTVQLDDTDLAVDETQAAELLPLWQALQSLGNSDTTATAETNAVVKQIEETMSEEQVEAIADMALTNASLTELMQSGELGFGGGFGQQGQSADGNQATGNFPGGGFPGGPGAGGPPGGGIPGGGGAPIDGGFANADGELSEDDLATRQAAFEGGDFQARMLSGMVIRLLAQKTGEDIGFPGDGNNPMSTVLNVISEATGLSVEAIQTQTADGVTLGEIVTANGGNTDDVHAKLVEALSAMPNAADQDFDQLATEWLAWPSDN